MIAVVLCVLLVGLVAVADVILIGRQRRGGIEALTLIIDLSETTRAEPEHPAAEDDLCWTALDDHQLARYRRNGSAP